MGLCTAGATFSRAMRLVLRGLNWEEVIMYLDDIIVIGTNFDGTLSALRKVFMRFREHNLKLKARKCRYFKEQVEFLGKLVSGDGVSISPDKLEAVKQWPTPTNAKELLSFLGFMNYHRNHIQNFAQVSADLYKLVHSDTFIGRSRQQACFDKLKELAISAPMLSHPSPDGLFVLDTDSSDHQLGGGGPSIKFKTEWKSPSALPVILSLSSIKITAQHVRNYWPWSNFAVSSATIC